MNATKAANPWFGVAMVSIGVVIGYGTATVVGGGVSSGGDTVAEVQPTPTPTPTAPTEPTAKDVVPVNPSEDRILGDENALLSLIVYTDYECPFCGRHHGTIKQLVEEEDDINVVYRHYPLPFHSNAQAAAESAECAGDQGKFWEFSDKIFEGGASATSLPDYAQELGLNMSKFNECVDSGKYTKKVEDQMASGSNSGIRGTPGNILMNNKTEETKFVSGAQPISAFKSAVEELK